MKKRISPKSARQGTTLTEVLMAILCMAIGVVAVASLFPIALLRSVQATQLTQATILRFNAETFVDLNPGLIVNPDNTTLGKHAGKRYLIDPLGWNIVNADGGNPGAVGNMARYNALTTSEDTAAALVTLPDSWVLMHEELPVSNTQTSVTLNTIPQEVSNALSSGVTLRVILFSENENLSEARFLTTGQINGNTISWQRPLPSPYTPSPYFNDKVPKVRIEFRDRRYTWLLSVRNFTVDYAVPQALVDVVVFFNRSAGIEEETPYALHYVKPRVYSVGNAGDKPFLKKGGFMLDTNTGAWHRIQKINEDTDPYQITLEKNTTANIDGDLAVFFRGVVDVYPLGTKP